MKLKKILILLAVSLLTTAGAYTYTAPVEAATMSYDIVIDALQRMSGNWYDSNGNLILSIQDKYINSCEVVSGADFAGGRSDASGYFTIAESNGYRTLKLDWHTHNPNNTYIIFNGQTLYRY